MGKARWSSLLPPALLACLVATWPVRGQAVGPEFQVNTYITERQQHPRVATDSAGNFVVVWESLGQDGSFLGVYGQRYDSSGTPLGAEFRVNSYTTEPQDAPSVTALSGGAFVVVWSSDGEDGSLEGVYAQRYDGAGAPLGAEFRVNTATTYVQRPGGVAADSAGNFVVVWESFAEDGSDYGVFAQRLGSAGAPVGGEFRVNAYTTDKQRFPAVASDPSGGFTVVWYSYGGDGSATGVFGRRYASSGAPLAGEFRVNTYTTSYQRFPSIASDSVGNFIVVWEGFDQDGSYFGVFGQRFGSGGDPVGGEFRVNSYTSQVQRSPSVASDSAGNFVVVWHSRLQDDATYNAYGVFGQRYGSAGTPLGPEFRVNTQVFDMQDFPSVASDAGGRFVVVWESNGQDGSFFGVFGQRFCAPGVAVIPPPAITTIQTLCQ